MSESEKTDDRKLISTADLGDDPQSTKNAGMDYGTSSRDGEPVGDEKEQEREPEVVGFPSCRQILYAMMFLGFAMAYALRVSLNEAIVAMVNHTAVQGENISYETECPRDPTLIHLSGEFNWDRRQQGILLAAFYYGYIFTQILGGWLADRVGGKMLFGGGILGTAVLTLFTPPVARFHFVAVVVLRVAEGVLEGFMIPATHAMLVRWTEESHTTRGVTMAFAGQELGIVLGMLLGGVLSDHGFAGGWPSVFYVFGTLGCIWSAAWFLLCYDSPSTHPRISAVERRRLEAAVGPVSKVESPHKRKTTPWRRIFTSAPMLACAIGKFAHIWGYQTVINGLPLFFFDVLGFSMTDNGLLTSIPFLGTMFMIAGAGHAADWLRGPGGGLPTTGVRKIFCVAGLVLPSFFFVVTGFLGCDRVLVVLTMVAAMACVACAWSCFTVNPLDLSRTHAATLFGIINSTATVAAILVPHVIGELTHYSPSRGQWRKVFYVTIALEWVGTVVYLIFGSGESQNWDDDDDDGDKTA